LRRPAPASTRNECLHADWYAIGLEDGAQRGANTERYVAGRNEGLKSFCTYERGPQPEGAQFLAATTAHALMKSNVWRRSPAKLSS
jgi:hypothetical protein